MIDSPSALAVASTAAATIAGLAALTVTARIARSGFSPSAIAPSRQELGTDASASHVSAIMIGAIITVRITTVTSSPAPVSSISLATEAFSEAVIRWLPTNGTSTSSPSSPYTTDGTEASRRITGIVSLRRRSGASSTMKIEANTETTNANATEMTVVNSVPYSSGQARR